MKNSNLVFLMKTKEFYSRLEDSGVDPISRKRFGCSGSFPFLSLTPIFWCTKVVKVAPAGTKKKGWTSPYAGPFRFRSVAGAVLFTTCICSFCFHEIALSRPDVMSRHLANSCRHSGAKAFVTSCKQPSVGGIAPRATVGSWPFARKLM